MDFDSQNIYPGTVITEHRGPGPDLMGASTLTGDHVHNGNNEHLGSVKEIMLDTASGKIAYVVVSHGGLLGIGEKLFAVPWSVLTLDTVNKRFILNIDKEQFEKAPGFDPDCWPDMADQLWVDTVQSYYKKSS